MSERKPNASKSFVRRTTSLRKVPQLNETVCTAHKENPNITVTASVSGVITSELMQTECDLTYNSYLQSLLKREILENKIKEQEKVLEGQILLQEKNIRKKQETLNQIKKNTELLRKKEEIVKMINCLEENINKIICLYENNQTQKNIQTIHSALKDKSGTLILKNIKLLNQEEYNRLIESVKKLAIASEKIVNCSRDFEGVHKLAEECRSLIQIIKEGRESHALLSAMEKHAGLTVLQKLSDEFAKQYENIE